jgi:hypothetical protein
MGRKSKKDRPPAIIQSVLADNVRRLRNKKYAALPHETAMNRALARDAGTVLAQIQRILGLELSPGIDMVEQLAGALEVRPADLLTPYFANGQTNGDESPFMAPPTPLKHRVAKKA